jgi:hypothetical protein
MFTLKLTKKKTTLDEVIDAALAQTVEDQINTPEYTQKMEVLTKLYKLKENDSKSRLSPDTIAIVAGNLAGIVLILGYEHAHAVTSKAFNLLLKPR